MGEPQLRFLVGSRPTGSSRQSLLSSEDASSLDVRTAVARELHDRVCHQLALAMQHIQLAQPPTPDLRLQHALTAVRDALEDIRDIAVGLRQVGGESLSGSIEDALATLADVRPKVFFRERGEPESLEPYTTDSILMIVLEAVRNSRRHSGANSVDVDVEWLPEALNVVVKDDGNGVATRATSNRSMGMSGMVERSALIGGTLEVVSTSRGTAVRLSWPRRQVPRD